MEELRDEILAVKEQLKHYQDLTSELQLERANMMGEHEALKSKLNESNNVLENLNEKENALSKELKELSDKNTELENDKILLQRKFENTKKGNLAMLENTNVLEEALQTANTTIGELKEEIKESNLKLVEEKSCSSKIKDEKLAVEAKLDESLKTIESLQCSIDGREKDVEGLENQLKEVSETKSQLEKQIQDENVKYVQDLTQLKSEIEERKNRELELKADVQRLQNIEQYCDSLKADLKVLKQY